LTQTTIDVGLETRIPVTGIDIEDATPVTVCIDAESEGFSAYLPLPPARFACAAFLAAQMAFIFSLWAFLEAAERFLRPVFGASTLAVGAAAAGFPESSCLIASISASMDAFRTASASSASSSSRCFNSASSTELEFTAN
jgi:hypothetical protein